MAELKEDPDACKHVVKEEEEGVMFYEEMAAQATDERTRPWAHDRWECVPMSPRLVQ